MYVHDYIGKILYGETIIEEKAEKTKMAIPRG
jgi:hypothetical protein